MPKKNAFIIEDLGVQELPDDIDHLVTQKIQEAEDDLQDVRLQIRWKTRQVNLIKRAAKLMGVPYETYAKQVLYRQAMDDIERSKALK